MEVEHRHAIGGDKGVLVALEDGTFDGARIGTLRPIAVRNQNAAGASGVGGPHENVEVAEFTQAGFVESERGEGRAFEGNRRNALILEDFDDGEEFVGKIQGTRGDGEMASAQSGDGVGRYQVRVGRQSAPCDRAHAVTGRHAQKKMPIDFFSRESGHAIGDVTGRAYGAAGDQ